MKLRRSACIDTLYLELPFLDRFQAAKEDGFDAVELWSWEDRDLAAVRAAADRAGIQAGDFILSANGREVTTSQELLRVRRQLYVGDQVTMELWRDGQRMEVTLTLTAPTE